MIENPKKVIFVMKRLIQVSKENYKSHQREREKREKKKKSKMLMNPDVTRNKRTKQEQIEKVK